MSFSLNTNIDLSRKDVIIQVCRLSTILRYHACVFTPRRYMWPSWQVFRSVGLGMFSQTSTITFGMVLSATWCEFEDGAWDPLIRWEPVSASCNRRPDEGLETQTYSLYHKEHPANCPLRWRLSNGFGCISHDCKLNLVTIHPSS
jgi:hypothetical protein